MQEIFSQIRTKSGLIGLTNFEAQSSGKLNVGKGFLLVNSVIYHYR